MNASQSRQGVLKGKHTLNYLETVHGENGENYSEIADKYILMECIGHGAQAKVFKSYAKETNEVVAIKIFDITAADDWKNIELFEREAKILKDIHVSGVPKYIDYIRGTSKYYLIEEYFDAQSIKANMMSGFRPSNKQVESILISTLEILAQLHAYDPPIIHRDIKPSNILIDIKDPEHIKTYIIDLGAVAINANKTQLGTIAGTLGYAAPEQFMGFASPSSDIYALGMTMVYMLTGKSPSEMELKGLSVDYERYLPTTLPIYIKELLDRMLQPTPQSRIGSAKAVLETLRVSSDRYRSLLYTHANKRNAAAIEEEENGRIRCEQGDDHHTDQCHDIGNHTATLLSHGI